MPSQESVFFASLRKPHSSVLLSGEEHWGTELWSQLTTIDRIRDYLKAGKVGPKTYGVFLGDRDCEKVLLERAHICSNLDPLR